MNTVCNGEGMIFVNHQLRSSSAHWLASKDENGQWKEMLIL
jgi:hypothetical protein